MELVWVHVAALAEKSHSDVEGGVIASILQDRSCRRKVGFAPVIKRDHNPMSLLSVLWRQYQRFAHAHTPPPCLLQPAHLRAKIRFFQHISRITCFRPAKGTAWNLQFVIHQEHNASFWHR